MFRNRACGLSSLCVRQSIDPGSRGARRARGLMALTKRVAEPVGFLHCVHRIVTAGLLVGPAAYSVARGKASMLTHTSLAQARRHQRIIPNSQRLNERRPVPVADINASDIGRARYLLEVATTHLPSGCWKLSLETLREAFTLGCRCRWMAIADKKTTSIVEPQRFLLKLRSCSFLTAEEHKAIRRLLIGYQPSSIFEIERMEMAVAKVIVA